MRAELVEERLNETIVRGDESCGGVFSIDLAARRGVEWTRVSV